MSEHDVKSQFFTMRVTAAERWQLEAAARREKLKASSWARRVLMERLSAPRAAPTAPAVGTPDPAAQPEL